MASPFSSLLEQVNQFAAERTAQQQAGFNIEAQLLERQAQQTRQNLAAQFLSKTDFSRDPAGSLRMLAAITNDTGLIKTSLDYDLKTKAFERQLQNVKALQEAIAGGDLTGIAQAAVGAEAEGLAGQAIALSKKKEDPLDQLYKQKQIAQAEQRIRTSQAAEERIRKETPLAGPEGAAQRAKFSALGKAQADAQIKLAQLPTAEGNINAIFDNFSQISPALTGPLAGRTVAQAEKVIQSTPALKAYYDTRKIYLSELSRFVGQSGVLTDQDLKLIEDSLPEVVDTPATVAAKKKNITEYIARKRKNYQDLSQGIGLSTENISPAPTQAAMEEATTEDELSDENILKSLEIMGL